MKLFGSLAFSVALAVGALPAGAQNLADQLSPPKAGGEAAPAASAPAKPPAGQGPGDAAGAPAAVLEELPEGVADALFGDGMVKGQALEGDPQKGWSQGESGYVWKIIPTRSSGVVAVLSPDRRFKLALACTRETLRRYPGMYHMYLSPVPFPVRGGTRDTLWKTAVEMPGGAVRYQDWTSRCFSKNYSRTVRDMCAGPLPFKDVTTVAQGLHMWLDPNRPEHSFTLRGSAKAIRYLNSRCAG